MFILCTQKNLSQTRLIKLDFTAHCHILSSREVEIFPLFLLNKNPVFVNMDPLTKAEIRATELSDELEQRQNEFTLQLLMLLKKFDRSLLACAHSLEAVTHSLDELTKDTLSLEEQQRKRDLLDRIHATLAEIDMLQDIYELPVIKKEPLKAPLHKTQDSAEGISCVCKPRDLFFPAHQRLLLRIH